MWSRLYLTPLLQAEEDRDQVRRYYADQARAKELGIEDKVYNSDRYDLTDLAAAKDFLFLFWICRLLTSLGFTASSALPSPLLPARSLNK
jgi:hypothetical protein